MIENMMNGTIEAEGFGGQKKVFTADYWQDLYAARQNGTVLQRMASAIEDHKVGKETVPCLIVSFGHIKGIMPLPKSGFTNRAQLRGMIGQQVAFKVVTILRDANVVELDRVQALELMANVTWEKLKEGTVRTAVARKIQSKTALVDIGGITAELSAGQLSWGFVNDVHDYLQVGDNFDVKIMKVDKENKKIEISVRELIAKPWPDCATRYAAGGQYLATVSGVVEYGVFCNLEPGVDALTQHLKMGYNQVKVGDKVIITIHRVDPKKEQIKAKILRLL
jgi:small subunit ribosomal protein S1